MFNSFSSALAALKAHAAAVDTVGHNLANVNTTGFKSVDIAFKDLVAESMGGQSEIGMGVAPPITVRNFTQGAIQASSGVRSMRLSRAMAFSSCGTRPTRDRASTCIHAMAAFR